jgi:hypothetical protein
LASILKPSSQGEVKIYSRIQPETAHRQKLALDKIGIALCREHSNQVRQPPGIPFFGQSPGGDSLLDGRAEGFFTLVQIML